MVEKKDILLSVKDLRTYFNVKEGLAKAVDGVSYHINQGETLGLVGESGCGKTVSALSILKLLDIPPAQFHSGQILFKDQDLLQLSEQELNTIRGRSISMVFQEPMTSLNPVLSIGFQIDEVMINHLGITAREARDRTIELLNMVDIPLPQKRAKEYPHQLSGGMRQRIMIALAIACDPELLIADEPTTALDVTIQAQIIELMLSLQDKLGTSILLITHDLGVIAETADRVAVMYAGKIVEEADVKTIFQNPLHPYTRGLLNSVPNINKIDSATRLQEIPGIVPNLCYLPSGCAFMNRCPVKTKICESEKPKLLNIENQHNVGCWVAQQTV
ncbi:MAG: ABC transporter ATP-binding protein [Desulfobacula sp.]|jgi:oligopeptide/dipeptide ABC transporter ATP-binding protein|uniref:ABC transporter ATP-binding protein n=1 Tax=Desulfobacula sp. TaxID=2593537 RepID=UPI002A12B3E2|nr:ABC transporter ATP-binding protein [Desulfobacula sp.]MBT5546192.1 ABC transporter ATP-binding protein [Desulfobacula sp.]MBT5973960.1 ABC transporter ATP-binding protein [Desulfobacula sp.]MBT7711370.1 ABC transporter ATP-binding protein [Deltaproteobacteria bacterium]